MNILILSTSDITGGAAIAAHRLAEALNNNGMKARMMVLQRRGASPYVVAVGSRRRNKWRKLWERGVMFLAHRCRRDDLFGTSIANTGYDVTQTPEFQQADIIHLHWTCQGLLSMRGIEKVLHSGKPIVWTMHDAWPVTAICHYTRGCTQCHTACQRCPQEDALHPLYRFAARRWKRKKQIYDNASQITFVACSQWLAEQARQSALCGHHRVVSIPNTINTRVFRKQDKQLARRRLNLPTDKQLLLFASQSAADPRKGMQHLVKALQQLIDNYPEAKRNTEVVILGGKADDIAAQLPLHAHCLGYLTEAADIVDAYNAADIFVLPSTEDNLPNTIMEAMACGVPSVGFAIGGIPEMIDHKQNGYVAAVNGTGTNVQVDTADMARGLQWILTEADRRELSAKALEKVHTTYAQQHVASLYIQQYQQLLVEQ